MARSLESLYKVVQMNSVVINESADGKTLNDSDGELFNLVPDEYKANYIPGSGKIALEGSEYAGEFKLKLEKAKWTDGIEDLEDTYEHIEREISSSMFNQESGPGGPFVKSNVIVQEEESNDEFIVVRCVFQGGFDV